MYYVYLIIIGCSFLLSTILSLLFDLEFFMLSLIVGGIILLIGVLSSTENFLKPMRVGGIFTYEVHQEIRREKDYTNRHETFGIGFMLRICGLIIIVISIIISLF